MVAYTQILALPLPSGMTLGQVASPLVFFAYLQNKGHELKLLLTSRIYWS